MLKTALMASALCLAGAAHAAPVFFDDFESYTPGAPSSLSPTWTVTEGSIDVIPVGSSFVWYGTGKYIDMNGSGGPSTAGRIETMVNLVAGVSYELSFAYGFNVNSGSNETLNFGIGSYTNSLVPTDFGAVVPPVFGQFSGKFAVAATGLYTLFFADGHAGLPYDDDNDQGGPIIDNVSISVVPLPASAPLLLLGIGAFAAMRRKRRA